MKTTQKFTFELTFTSEPTEMDKIGMDGLYFKSIERLPSNVRDAVEAWRDWFALSDGNPWKEDKYGRNWCFFCGRIQAVHAADCPFLRAQKLLRPQA